MPRYTGGTLYSSDELGAWSDNLVGKLSTTWDSYKEYGAKADETTAKQPGPVVWLQSNWKPIVVVAALFGGAYFYLYKRKK